MRQEIMQILKEKDGISLSELADEMLSRGYLTGSKPYIIPFLKGWLEALEQEGSIKLIKKDNIIIITRRD